MKNLILLTAMVALLTTIAVGQNTASLPSPNLTGNALARGTTGAIHGEHAISGTNLFFCPPKTCLYYAGDPPTGKEANGLFDFDNPGIGISDAEVWVGVKPTKNAIVVGASGNYYTDATMIGINPTPFQVQTGITSGKAGKLVCNTSGNATIKPYGTGAFGLNSENYYIKKMAKACHFNARTIYFVYEGPQYNDGSTIGYLADVEKPVKNHKGWPILWDDSYFNSSSFGVTYANTSGTSGACGGIGCDAFSISLTGTE